MLLRHFRRSLPHAFLNCGQDDQDVLGGRSHGVVTCPCSSPEEAEPGSHHAAIPAKNRLARGEEFPEPTTQGPFCLDNILTVQGLEGARQPALLSQEPVLHCTRSVFTEGMNGLRCREKRRSQRHTGSVGTRAKSLSCIRLFATPQTVAHQAPLSMGFSKQEYWGGLPCPPPGDLPNPGIEP